MFARLAQIVRGSKHLGFGYSARQFAKAPSSEENNISPQSRSLPLLQPYAAWRRCGGYADFLFAFFAPFAANYPIPLSFLAFMRDESD
jgi:hypothetical protein